MTKTCTKCGEDKPLTEFYVHIGRKLDLSEACKPCTRARIRARYKIVREYRLAYQKTDPHKKSVRKYQATVKGRFQCLKSNAKRRNLPQELSLSDLANVIAKPCEYCGLPIGPTGAGVDRKDNLAGYTLDNCVPCCWTCNKTKREEWTHAEFLEIGKVIRRLKDKRSAA